MSEPNTQIQTLSPTPEDEEHDTQAEFNALWADAEAGENRLKALAQSAEAKHPEIAAVYREMAGSIMGLMKDLVAATGGAITSLEEEIDDPPVAADASVLMPEDAEKYQELFTQFLRMLDGLAQVVPSGSDGDKQREIFATLRRMTEGLIEYTTQITAEDDDDPEEPEAGAPEDD